MVTEYHIDLFKELEFLVLRVNFINLNKLHIRNDRK